jgi:hypothetical protein
MSMIACHLHKAGQCAQSAKEATDPGRRADYEKEQRVWLQLAEEIEPSEETEPKSKPN